MNATSRSALALVLLLLAAPVLATIPAPVDVDGGDTLAVDGYVITKFVSVGNDVEILAKVRGLDTSQEVDRALVSADILHMRDLDPIDALPISPANPPVHVDSVALAYDGEDPYDEGTTVWRGAYRIPVDALGGVYAASVTVQSEGLQATDDPFQLGDVVFSEVESTLQVIDASWDAANPMAGIAAEFTDIEDIVEGGGGWSQFVADATTGDGLAGAPGTGDLWQAMIDAGHDEDGYNMSAGAAFLEELMVMLDSDDAAASVGFMLAVMTFADEFPIPNVMEEFQDIPGYLATFDLIENFTRFEGTGDFEAAYNAMTGSTEWSNITEALDDLAEQRRIFQSIETLMHNIALLAVSNHPEAILDGLEAYVAPLMEEDFENATPFQRFIVAFAIMAEELDEETDVTFAYDDGPPERITWQYEKLLATTEGQAWAASVESDHAYVNDAFDAFNTLPEDILTRVWESVDNEVWEEAGEALEDLGMWLENATMGGDSMQSYWDEWNEDPARHVLGTLEPFRTFGHSSVPTHIGLAIYVEGDESNLPDSLTIGLDATDGAGEVDAVLPLAEGECYSGGYTPDSCWWGDSDTYQYYTGSVHLPLATEDRTWAFEDFEATVLDPLLDADVLDDQGDSDDNVRVEFDLLSPPLLEQLATESGDEVFTVSSLGVMVESGGYHASVGDEISFTANVFDGEGIVEGADVEMQVMRIAPQAGLDFLERNGFVDEASEDDSDDDWDDSGDGEDQFQCDNGNEIPMWWVNDGSDDCGDNSDEGVMVASDLGVRTETEYECADGAYTLPEWYLNDGEDDCPDGSDEQDDARQTLNRTTELWAGLDGPGSETYDEASDSTYCYAADITLKDPSSDEVVHQANSIRIHEWGRLDYAFGPYDGDRGFQMEAYIHEYVIDNGTECPDENGILDLTGLTYQRTSDVFEETVHLLRYIDGAYLDIYDGYLDFNVHYRNVDRDDDDYELRFFLHDESGDEAYVHDTFVHSDDWNTYADEDVDLEPGTYCPTIELKTIDETSDGEVVQVVDSNTHPWDLRCVTVEETVEFTPAMVDELFNGGPFQVVESVDLVTSTTGEAVVSITADVAGLYVAVVQAQVGLDDGTDDQLTGVGASFKTVTEGGLTVTGLTEAATFAGLPIRTTSADAGGLTQVTFTPTLDWDALEDDAEVSIVYGVAAVNVSDLFPDLDGAAWGESIEDELDLQPGDASRTEELRLPTFGLMISMVLIDGEVWPRGVDVAFVMAQPGELALTGDLGPGQTTNVALQGATAERILAIAGPAAGLDPSIVDVPTFSNTIYDVIKEESVGWAAHDRNAACGEFDGQYGLECSEESRYRSTFECDDGEVISSDWVNDDWEDCADGSDEGVEDFRNPALDELEALLVDLRTIAWGEGSSADVHMPLLATPADTYTVLSLAQVGSGDAATLTTALRTVTAVPNPEPPTIKSLTATFSPADPRPGDELQVQVLDVDELTPVEGLSVVMSDGELLLVTELTDSNGQASFVVPAGALELRISGLGFEPVVFSLVVDETGIVLEDGTILPVDSDLDGVIDLLDAFPDDPTETTDTDGDGIGDNSDPNPTVPDVDPEDTIDQVSDEDVEGGLLPLGGGIVNVLFLGAAVAAALHLRREDETL